MRVSDQLSRFTFRALAQTAFGLFLILTFTTPSWRYGMFSWWPVWQFAEVAGAPLQLGIFNFLPAVVGVAWAVSVWQQGTNGRFPALTRLTPGAISLTLPFLLLTLWALFSLDVTFPRLVFIHGGGILLAWLVYFYYVNERPSLFLPLVVILLVQSGVALGQFFKQEDLQLTVLGELPLHPAWNGITVLYARDTRWLRAYGLTAHPNLLGAILAIFLLFLLPVYLRTRGRGQIGWGVVLAVGFMGLFVSFSRAAWLAFAVGTLVYLLIEHRHTPFTWQTGRNRLVQLLLPALPALGLLAIYGDLAFSRLVALDTPLETRSLEQRGVDTQTAVQIIQQNSWLGVGFGNYVDAADHLNQASGSYRVHNVPLLVTAELGLVGLLLWLWLMVVPLWQMWQRRNRQQATPAFQPPSAAPALWAAMLLINQFDTMVWLSSNWQTAVLFALLVAVAAEERGQYPVLSEQ